MSEFSVYTKIKRDCTFFLWHFELLLGKVADIDTPPELSSIFPSPVSARKNYEVYRCRCLTVH